jgi:hypothetical protein
MPLLALRAMVAAAACASPGLATKDTPPGPCPVNRSRPYV